MLLRLGRAGVPRYRPDGASQAELKRCQNSCRSESAKLVAAREALAPALADAQAQHARADALAGEVTELEARLLHEGERVAALKRELAEQRAAAAAATTRAQAACDKHGEAESELFLARGEIAALRAAEQADRTEQGAPLLRPAYDRRAAASYLPARPPRCPMARVKQWHGRILVSCRHGDDGGSGAESVPSV